MPVVIRSPAAVSSIVGPTPKDADCHNQSADWFRNDVVKL